MGSIDYTEAVNGALDRLHTTGFYLDHFFANHGPMAAEALATLGYCDVVDRWVDANIQRRKYGPLPKPSQPISDWPAAVGDGALIGMGSIILNGAKIGRDSIVGAGSVITAGKQFPANSLIIGSPARVIRTLEPDQVQNIGRDAKSYQRNGPRYKNGLRKIG